MRVPHAELVPALEAALKSAFSAGRIVRGLESAERALAGEERGLRLVDRKTGPIPCCHPCTRIAATLAAPDTICPGILPRPAPTR